MIQQQLSNFVKVEIGDEKGFIRIKHDVNTKVSVKSGEIIKLNGLVLKNISHSTSFGILPFIIIKSSYYFTSIIKNLIPDQLYNLSL